MPKPAPGALWIDIIEAMSHRPPTPIGIERRLFERFEFYADVTLHNAGDRVSLRAKDLSIGGMAVEVSRGEATHLEAGMSVHVSVVFETEDGELLEIHTPAKVVHRQDADAGFGVIGMSWDANDADLRGTVEKILQVLRTE